MTLEFRNISKKVGAETHIYPASFKLDAAGFNVLLGATNAGKTTLIKMIAGLDKPTSGEIELNGENLLALTPQQRNVSLVHQFFINYPHMNVFDNIASPLKVAGIKGEELQRRVHEAAEIMQLHSMLKRYPQELSGGQQQRIALARALVKESRIVLLDEPLANLDYKLREELRDQLPAVFAGRGSLVIYATSDPTEALLLGGTTVAMQAGHITQVGTTADVYHHPQNIETARVFSDPPINEIPVEITQSQMVLPTGQQWPLPPCHQHVGDGQYILAIRAHHVLPRPTDKTDSLVNEAASLSGKVEIVEITGSESIAHFALGDTQWVSLANGIHHYDVGSVYHFEIDLTHSMLFDLDGQPAGLNPHVED